MKFCSGPKGRRRNIPDIGLTFKQAESVYTAKDIIA
jgi:hypothetical protein